MLGRITCIVLVFLLWVPHVSSAAEQFTSQLSEEELARVNSGKPIRIAFDGYFPPYSFLNESDELEGFAVEFLQLLSQRTGLEFDVVPIYTWNDIYDAALTDQIDVVATMVDRPERRQNFLFSRPYIYKTLAIMTRREDNRILVRENLAGRTLAVVDGYQYVDRVLEEFPSVTPLYVDTMLDALNAVSTEEADAVVSFMGAAHFVRSKYLMTNLRFAAIYDDEQAKESFAVRSNQPVLASVLDKALTTIAQADRMALERKWLPVSGEVRDVTRFELTEAEKRWIEAHPVIRLGVDPEFRPFEFIDEDGNYRGYAADYVQLLNQRLGLNMQIQPDLSWAEVTELIRQRELDVLPIVGRTEERESFLEFTQPYVEFHRVIVTDVDAPFLSGIQDLKDMRVAVQANSSHHGFITDRTEIEPLHFGTLQETIRAVSDGRADAMVGNIAATSYWIRRMNLTNLKVAAAASDEIFTLHFAIRDDWPELAGILKKGLASVTDAEREAIAERWIILRHDPKIDYVPIIVTILIASLIVAIVMYSNAYLRRTREAVQQARDQALKANAELAAIREDLEDLVVKRTDELMASERRFHQAQKMESLGTLVAGLAHDFNNILAGMLGIISLVQLEEDEDSSKHKRLQEASDLGFRGAGMIKGLLGFARTTDSQKSVTDLSKLLQDVEPIARASVPNSIELKFDTGDGLAIYGSVPLLEQAIVNMINNARDALLDRDDGVISVSAVTYTPSITFRTRYPELNLSEYIEVQINDNGKGMAKGTLARIFDPFFSTKAPGEGTGLGLAMVYGTIQDHGGVIEVQSKEGEGTNFTIYLPQSEYGEIDNSDQEAVVRGNGELILLADDDTSLRSVHKSLLENIGYEVIAVEDGEEMVRVVKERGDELSLLLVDVVMPRLNGLAAVRKVRELYADLPVIFLTAHESDLGMQKYLRKSRENILEKPCSLALLSRSVSRCLR